MLLSVVNEKGSNPFWAGMRYTPGADVPLIAEPLASACEAEEVLASGVVHVPELLAMPGLDVQVSAVVTVMQLASCVWIAGRSK